MSTLIVPTCKIDNITPHSNADTLELAHVSAWQCIIPKGKYKVGDLVTYIPPDSILPLELSDKLSVTKYLRNQRVKSIKLRGEPSHGLVIDPVEGSGEGENVAEKLGITKYDPDVHNPQLQGGGRQDHPYFVRFTDMENLRHYLHIFQEGEEVIVTEKIHGTNSRIGLLWDEDSRAFRWTVGSKKLQRDLPEPGQDPLYWFPYSIEEVRSCMMQEMGYLLHTNVEKFRRIIMYGEIYGSIQKLDYGSPNALRFRAFDMLINDSWVDACTLHETLPDYHGVPTVPVLYRGPFTMSKIIGLSKGLSTVGGTHIREGVVVRPTRERTDPKIGRVIMKYVSDDYLTGDWEH